MVSGLSFSQAQGLGPLPKPLALGEVSNNFRMDVWNWFYRKIKSAERTPASYYISGEWLKILSSVHANLFHESLDSFERHSEELGNKFKEMIIGRNYLRWNLLFDLIQFVLRSSNMDSINEKNAIEMRDIFHRNLLAYDIIDVPPAGATIVPTASPEEGDAIRSAFAALAEGPLDGARTHLRKAAEAINAGLPADAIREAINAVESTVRVIAPNKNFEDALKVIDAKANIHPALRIGLTKLYAYTSDEKGIRHPLLESDTARVGMAEAIFMFGACASFASYLIGRGRGAGVLKG